MQQIFKIAADTVPEDGMLCVLIGADHIGYCLTDRNSTSINKLAWYSVKNADTAALTEILEEPSAHVAAIRETVVAYDNNANTLVPTRLLNGDLTAALYLAGADQQDVELIEHIPAKGITNVYTAPYHVHDWLRTNWPGARYLHLKTVLADAALQSIDTNGALYADISNNEFHVTAVQGEKLLLSQSYPYTNPADVAFYLLKICEAHQLDQQSVQLKLSGFIEKDSSLYQYLYQYFLHIGFDEATWQYPADATALPSHLFTSLYKISKCALLQDH